MIGWYSEKELPYSFDLPMDSYYDLAVYLDA